MEKLTFQKAFEQLNKTDARVAKHVLIGLCKWKSPGHFYAKMSGTRALVEKNESRVNEIKMVERTFHFVGINAWTGEALNL